MRFSTAAGVKTVNDKIASRSNDQLIDDAMAIGGSPDTVCRQIERWQEVGLDQFIFMLQAGNTTHEQILRSIDLIGEKVIPRFANKSAPARDSRVPA